MYLDSIKDRFQELDLHDEVRPCTRDEVEDLEQRLGFHLPLAYQEFLLWMGKGARDFLSGSDCWYDNLPFLRGWAIELLAENKFEQAIPDDALIFFMHGGYQFNFLLPQEGEDPPVHFYGEWTHQSSFTIAYPHYSDFLAVELEDHAKLIASINALRSEREARDSQTS